MVGAAGEAHQSGGGEIIERRRAERFERAELGDRLPVDGHDHPLAACGPAHDGGDVVAELPHTDALHVCSVARVYTSRLGRDRPIRYRPRP